MLSPVILVIMTAVADSRDLSKLAPDLHVDLRGSVCLLLCAVALLATIRRSLAGLGQSRS